MLRLRVKEVATEKGISMTKLSQRSEVSYNTIKDMYKNPYHNASTDTLNRLARVLGVPAIALLEDISPELANAEKAKPVSNKRPGESDV
ncbi:MAG TPA: helix-turn-helix transcriptional regulator [Ktedonobacteraceae bacterium]|nr:helix-turn-helix transcriptional regulator [Ktedonobacteraceae bacterium]